jgi:hypothetical protein
MLRSGTAGLTLGSSPGGESAGLSCISSVVSTSSVLNFRGTESSSHNCISILIRSSQEA